MTENNNSKELIEFYQHTTNINPEFCDHRFHRLSITRIVCKRCGLGFFDTPFNPFPVEEMNKKAREAKKEAEEFRKQKLVENND